MTSLKEISVLSNNNKITKLVCRDEFKPNLKNEDKKNYITPHIYILDNDSNKINELVKLNLILQIQKLTKSIHASFISDKNEKILYLKNGKFVEVVNEISVQDYCKENKILLCENFDNIILFEKLN